MSQFIGRNRNNDHGSLLHDLASLRYPSTEWLSAQAVGLQWAGSAPSTPARRITQCPSGDGGRWWIAQCAREGTGPLGVARCPHGAVVQRVCQWASEDAVKGRWFEPQVKRQIERAARLDGSVRGGGYRLPKGGGLTPT